MLYLPQVPPLSIPEEAEDLEEKEEETKDKDEDGNAIGKDEILTFPTNCPECNAPAETNMKMTCESVLLCGFNARNGLRSLLSFFHEKKKGSITRPVREPSCVTNRQWSSILIVLGRSAFKDSSFSDAKIT